MYTVGEGLDPPYQYATMLLREGQDPPLQEIYQICHSEEARMADVGIGPLQQIPKDAARNGYFPY